MAVLVVVVVVVVVAAAVVAGCWLPVAARHNCDRPKGTFPSAGVACRLPVGKPVDARGRRPLLHCTGAGAGDGFLVLVLILWLSFLLSS